LLGALVVTPAALWRLTNYCDHYY